MPVIKDISVVTIESEASHIRCLTVDDDWY